MPQYTVSLTEKLNDKTAKAKEKLGFTGSTAGFLRMICEERLNAIIPDA